MEGSVRVVPSRGAARPRRHGAVATARKGAATIALLFVYGAAVEPSAPTRVERVAWVRREPTTGPKSIYDEARDSYDSSANLRVTAVVRGNKHQEQAQRVAVARHRRASQASLGDKVVDQESVHDGTEHSPDHGDPGGRRAGAA